MSDFTKAFAQYLDAGAPAPLNAGGQPLKAPKKPVRQPTHQEWRPIGKPRKRIRPDRPTFIAFTRKRGPIFRKGKYRDQRIEDTPISYRRWLANNAENLSDQEKHFILYPNG